MLTYLVVERSWLKKMKVSEFEYHAPTQLADAVALLASLSHEDAQILAGGQSLVPTMAFRLASPKHLIDINRISELQHFDVDGERLRIGAGVRHAAFIKRPEKGPLFAILSQIAAHIAHYPVRSRGTFCGSLAHADPASEWCLTAATFDATIIATSVRGTRLIPAEDFFEGLLSTALTQDEILTEVQIPLPSSQSKFGFYEFNRRAGDYAIGMALARWELQDDRMIDVHFGLGGIESKPRRIRDAEVMLEGKLPSDPLFSSVADVIALGVEPLEDLQADAAYRRDIARVVARRALDACSIS